MLRRILALARKELRVLWKDKRSRMSLILPPLFQLLVFGYAATFDLNQVPYAVYNQDPGLASRELLARFEGSTAFSLAGRLESLDQASRFLDERRVLLVVNIGQDFSRDLARGHTAKVQVLIDGRNSNTALVALGYLREMVSRFSAEWMAEHGQGPTPARLAVRFWFNPNLESRWFIVPGILGLLTLVLSLLVTGLSVAREREQGTFDQLLVTPFRPFEILVGKSLPGLLIGMVEVSVIILVAVFWFRVPLRGDLTALYLGLFLFLLSGIGVGLMISSFAKTQQQALLGAFLFMTPAVILSGFATPLANMPEAVQRLTLLNPLRYFLIVVRKVFLEGSGVTELWPYYWPMALIGLTCLTLAGWLFRRRLA